MHDISFSLLTAFGGFKRFLLTKIFRFFYMKSVGNKLNDIRAVLDSSRRCTRTLLLFFWLYLSSQRHIHTNTTSIWNDTNTRTAIKQKRTKIHVINIYANFKVEIFSFFCYIIFLRSYSYHLTSLSWCLHFCRFVRSVLSSPFCRKLVFTATFLCSFSLIKTFVVPLISAPHF